MREHIVWQHIYTMYFRLSGHHLGFITSGYFRQRWKYGLYVQRVEWLQNYGGCHWNFDVMKSGRRNTWDSFKNRGSTSGILGKTSKSLCGIEISSWYTHRYVWNDSSTTNLKRSVKYLVEKVINEKQSGGRFDPPTPLGNGGLNKQVNNFVRCHFEISTILARTKFFVVVVSVVRIGIKLRKATKNFRKSQKYVCYKSTWVINGCV